MSDDSDLDWASVLSPEAVATTLSGLRPRPLPPAKCSGEAVEA